MAKVFGSYPYPLCSEVKPAALPENTVTLTARKCWRATFRHLVVIAGNERPRAPTQLKQ